MSIGMLEQTAYIEALQEGRREDAMDALYELIKDDPLAHLGFLHQVALSSYWGVLDRMGLDVQGYLDLMEIAEVRATGLEVLDHYHAKARALEKAHRYDEAWRTYHAGNLHSLHHWQDLGEDYDPAMLQGAVGAIYQTQTRANMLRAIEACPLRVVRSDIVLHVCGIPRSGTTLTEAVLARHPLIKAGGELGLAADFIEKQVDPYMSVQELRVLVGRATVRAAKRKIGRGRSERYLVDKMPGMAWHLGTLMLALPEARFVLMRRSLMDTAVSAWRTGFSEGHAWSCDLDSMAHYLALFWLVQQHWAQEMPDRVHILRYENLVGDLEDRGKGLPGDGTTQALIEACGLTWDEACLEPHKARHTVNTASIVQVRRPPHRRSIGRWSGIYAEQLEPLRRALLAHGVPEEAL